MYSNLKSVKFTLVITYIFCVILGIMMITASPIISFLFGRFGMSKFIMLIAFYVSCPAAWIALISIIKLLKNILKDEIFSDKSVKHLKRLSTCCAFVSLVSFISMFFSSMFYVFFLGAGLMSLILTVLKSVMARAIEIKEENELTI